MEKSRAAEALQNIKTLRNALDAYYLEKGEYTTDMSDLAVTVPDGKYFVYAINVDGPRAVRGKNLVLTDQTALLTSADYWLHYVRPDYASDTAIAGKIICDAKAGYEQYCIGLGGIYHGATGYSAKRYIL